jgi:general secretion pathway protein F
MTAFSYLVADANGRKLRGEIEAASESQAAEQLRQRGDTVLEVREAGAGQQTLRLESSARLTDRQLADLAFELRSLLVAGIPLPRALSTISESAGAKHVASLARDLKLQLELGNPASVTLLKSGSSGQSLFGRFLAAAEQGGRYDVMLEIAANHLAQRAQAGERLRAALAYPIFLLFASLAAIAFLIIVVAPSLAPMFEGQGAPSFIQFAAAVGTWVQVNDTLTLAVLAALVGFTFLVLRSRTLSEPIARAASALPWLSRIAAGLEFGPATLAYAALLKAGWPAERSLRLAADLSRGRANRAFGNIAARLRDGATLAAAFRSEPNMPASVRRAVIIGEETGTVPVSLQRAGEYLVARSVKDLERLSAAIAPVMIVAIGALVAVVMVSMLSSISSIADAAL